MATALEHEVDIFQKKNSEDCTLACTCGWESEASSQHFAEVIKERHLMLQKES